MDYNITFALDMILELPKEVYLNEHKRWCKPCPSCGVLQTYLRKNYAILSFLEKKECKKCSNRKPENNKHKGWISGILRESFVNKLKTGAILRNIEWNLEYKYLAELLKEQNYKCALSDLDIHAKGSGNNTASLDRINSEKGYIVGNVQWVHKHVNFMKQKYDQDYFISICKMIADKVKW